MDYKHTFSVEYDEQLIHERFKQWMVTAGWSISYSRDPLDIFILIEEHGEDLTNDDLNTNTKE